MLSFRPINTVVFQLRTNGGSRVAYEVIDAMTTEAKVRVTGDVTLVAFDGPVVAGNGDEVLRDTLQELTDSGCRKVLLNLSDVPRLDSAGVGQLVASHRAAKQKGVDVKVVGGAGRVWRVLELTDILPLLDTYPSEAEALAAFEG